MSLFMILQVLSLIRLYVRLKRLAIGGQVFDRAGQYDIPFKNALNCDSIVHLTIRIEDTLRSSIDTAVCTGVEVIN